MAMVRVGSQLYDQNQMFTAYLDSVVKPVKVNAAKMAQLLSTGGGGGQPATRYSMGNTTEAGMLQGYQMVGERIQQKAPAAPKPAPAPVSRPAPKRTALTAPPQTTAPSAPVTAKERAEVSKPAKGLEDTIKTTPTLLREKRRRSYLTRT